MRPHLLAALLALSLLPTAYAQAPAPDELVLLACDTLSSAEAEARDALPLCPREEPPAPAADAAAQAPAPPPAPAPTSAQDPHETARDVAEELTGIVDDPPSAPARVAAIVERALRAIEDALALPPRAAAAVVEAIDATHEALRDAAADAMGRLAALLDGSDRARAELATRPLRAPAQAPTLDAPLRELREALPRAPTS